MSDNKRIKIVGNHPHRGSRGTIRNDKPQKLGMWLVELDADSDPCFAGACYVDAVNLRSLPAEEDPYA